MQNPYPTNNTGRPPLYDDPAVMEQRINEYFEYIFIEDKPKPTITGLVLYLGFADRSSFYEYQKKEEFSHTIKRARTAIEHWYELNLMGNHTAGAIFALKNFGWVDTQQIDHTSKGEQIVLNITSKEDKETIERSLK